MKNTCFSLLVPLALATFMVGCNSGPDPIIQNEAAITSAKTMRAYFDQSKGDFSALSPTDQAAAEKSIGGNAADVQKMFDWMKTSNKTGVPGAQPGR